MHVRAIILDPVSLQQTLSNGYGELMEEVKATTRYGVCLPIKRLAFSIDKVSKDVIIEARA